MGDVEGSSDWHISMVESNWDFAADQLNTNLRTIGERLRTQERQIAALEAEIEKLRAAMGIGDDEPTSD
ncbi:MAG: hypothetical protein ACJ76S_13865 [Solirubrobacteraceae bacterium]